MWGMKLARKVINTFAVKIRKAPERNRNLLLLSLRYASVANDAKNKAITTENR